MVQAREVGDSLFNSTRTICAIARFARSNSMLIGNLMIKQIFQHVVHLPELETP